MLRILTACFCSAFRSLTEFAIAGPVHFVVVNTELPVFPSTAQFRWLATDLASINRAQTPWTVVMGHRPSVFIEQPVAELLFSHQVDLTVAGHVHYTQRSCPLSPFSGCVTAPNATGGFDGTVHVVAGNGGQALSNATKPSKLWPYTGSGCNWTAPAESCRAADQKLKVGDPNQHSVEAQALGFLGSWCLA